jgi:hypothetical protein
MEIKDYFEYQGNTIKEQIENLLKESNYGVALSLAEKEHLVDEQIKIYEKMRKNCGTVSSYAGKRMEYYGLFKKALEYYQSREDSKGIESIKNLISISPEEFRENSKILVKCYNKPEENPKTWEIIYKVGKKNQEEIKNLKETLTWEPFLNKLIGFAGKN